MDNKLIKVDDLSFRYAGAELYSIKHISFEVEKGETVGIIGHTGAGKSTLGYCLRGLAPESVRGRLRGNIYIDGVSIKDMSLKELAERFGIVFQDPESQIIGSMVLEDMVFGMSNLEYEYHEMLDSADKMLDRLKLLSKKYVETANLSGGQKQRLAIGGVLTMKPHILFLDEPTTELDPVGKKEVFDMIREIKKNDPDTTILLVSHQVELLAEIADRILVMCDGELIKEGKPYEIFADDELMNKVSERSPQGISLVKKLYEKGIGDPDQLKNYDVESISDYLYKYCVSEG